MSDWGTNFPKHLDAVAELAAEVEKEGGDIFEVRVQLDNGEWRVDIFWTDEDLDQHQRSWTMSTHGGVR